MLGALALVAGVVLWKLAVVALAIEPYILPPPETVISRLVDGIGSGSIVTHTYVTGAEIVVGFVAGSLLGIGLGIVIALNRWIEFTVYPYIVAFNSIPTVAITPLIVIWFGTSFQSIVIITALLSFFPLLVNVIVGLHSADGEQVSFMRSLTATKWQTFRIVRIPSALPSVFAGLEMAVILSIVGAIVGEFIGSQEGLGYYIILSQTLLDTAGMFVSFIILALIGALLSVIVKQIGRKTVFWQEIEHRGYA